MKWKNIGWAVVTGVGLIILLGVLLHFGWVSEENQLVMGGLVVLVYVITGSIGALKQTRPLITGVISGLILGSINLIAAYFIGIRFPLVIILLLLANVSLFSLLGGGIVNLIQRIGK